MIKRADSCMTRDVAAYQQQARERTCKVAKSDLKVVPWTRDFEGRVTSRKTLPKVSNRRRLRMSVAL